MLQNLISITIIILESLCCQIFFDIFQGEKKRNYERVKCVVLLTCMNLINAILFRELVFVKLMITILNISVVMWFIRGFAYIKAFILATLYMGLLTVIEYLGLIYVQLIMPDIGNMTEAQEIIGSFVIVLDIFVMFICVIIIRIIFQRHKSRIIYNREWIKYVLFPVITMVMLSVIVTTFGAENDTVKLRALYGFGLGLVVMNFVMFYLFEDVIRFGEDIRNKEALEIQSRNQLEMYTRLRETVEKQRAESHEFKNHIMCIQSLAEQQKYDELDNYLHTINESSKYSVPIIDTNNVIVNSVINTKYIEAADKHIIIVPRVNDLSDIPLEDKDIVVILSNLLDNAIEAVTGCESDKVIYFKFVHENGNIILSVKNHYSVRPVKDGERYISTKEADDNIHGYGIKNVIRIIEKYNGSYDISTDKNEFVFSVLI